jgi:hypothetical protein
MLEHAPVDIVDTVAPRPSFTAQDRCDTRGCGAQAYVRAIYGESDLYFCIHHYREREEKLIGTADDIIFDMLGMAAIGATL